MPILKPRSLNYRLPKKNILIRIEHSFANSDSTTQRKANLQPPTYQVIADI